MADLTQAERVEISSKLVGIDDEIALVNQSKDTMIGAKEENEDKDAPKKKLLDERTDLINSYQNELKFLDGTTRTEMTEILINDGAKRILGNPFFPIDQNTPLPSLPDGLWRFFIPFSRTYATGKDGLEAFAGTGARTESNIISDINAKIASIEAEPVPERATGQECIPGGSCADEDNPPQLTEAACLLDNGTWTPGSDTYASYTPIQTLLTDLKTLVSEWETRVNDEKAEIPTLDKNSTRTTGNTNATNDIDNTISVIDTWQAVQDFDTSTSLPTGFDGAGCALYDALVEGSFDQAKLQATTLQDIKDELTARSSYISTRISELSGNDYLGSVTQSMATGSLTDKQGLYGERMLFLDSRINILKGSLTQVVNLEGTVTAQDALIEGAENEAETLDLVMVATKANAPGINTKYLNFKDLSGFSVGDRIYLVANEQQELSGSIDEINGNRARLTFSIPKKYTTSNNTRLYKLL